MKFLSFITIVTLGICSMSQTPPENFLAGQKPVKTGAEQTEKYVPYLKGKRVAILANPTSVIGKTHLVDSLKKLGVNIVKVFGPEHGFRGNASAGAKVADEIDVATGIPVFHYMVQKVNPVKKTLLMLI
jgi:uncharacterized protein YbbC (DUF1343 family)